MSQKIVVVVVVVAVSLQGRESIGISTNTKQDTVRDSQAQVKVRSTHYLRFQKTDFQTIHREARGPSGFYINAAPIYCN